MKVLYILGVIVLVGSFVFNLSMIDYSTSFLTKENQPYIIGLAAGVCGLLVALILFRYSNLKNNLPK